MHLGCRTRPTLHAAIPLAMAFAATAHAQCHLQTLEGTLFPPNGFANTAALTDGFIAVREHELFESTHHILMFRDNGEEWVLSDNLRLPTDCAGSGISGGISLDGDTLAASAPGGYDGSCSLGAVYMFRFTGADWVDEQTILPEDPEGVSWFGRSTDLDGDLLAVGAPKTQVEGVEQGVVFLFERVDGRWVEDAIITDPDPVVDESFGGSVDVDGDVMIIGANLKDHSGLNAAGAALIYRRQQDGEWGFEQEITQPGALLWQGFGGGVDIEGDTAVLPQRDHRVQDMNQAGVVFVFKYDTGAWRLDARLAANPPNAFERFGTSVDLSDDGDTLLVSTSGSSAAGPDTVYQFRRIDGEWEQSASLLPPDNAFSFSGGRLMGDLALARNSDHQAFLYAGLSNTDCNSNGRPDSCDILLGNSADENGNGIPDECEDSEQASQAAQITRMLNAWGPCADCPLDRTGDGRIDGEDLARVLYNAGESGPCPGEGDCCAPNGTPGCDNPDCCTSVCAADPYCCESVWDELCSIEARTFCGCPEPASCAPDAGDCCAFFGNGTPGCADPECCSAVCSIDAHCCDVEWDAICFSEAQNLCGCPDPATCGAGAGTCCDPNGSPGCEDKACCKQICDLDPFCCELEWDGICADLALDMCDIDCP